METAEKLRRAISKDKKKSRFNSGEGALFVVPNNETKNSTSAADTFVDLLDQFEKKITNLARSRAQATTSCAEEICSLLRELLRNLTGALVVSDALTVLADYYWADPVIVSMIEKIESDALRVIQSLLPVTRKSESYNSHQQIARLRNFSEWLRRRQATLCYFEDRAIVETAAVVIRSVLHDRERLGVRGFEVLVSARLESFEYQALWLCLQLYADGEPVLVRPEWSLWQEDGELFIVSKEEAAALNVPKFTTVIPITPSQQRLLIDAATLFVPYAALDVVTSRRTEIEIEVLLLSEAGISIAADASTEFCAVPPDSQHSPTIPSPLSLGFWPHNLSTGEIIRQLTVAPSCAIVANREVHVVQVAADLELYNREGQVLTVEIRFLTRAGHLIESELEGYRTPNGTFLYSQPLYPDSECMRYSPLRLSIPLIALELDPGQVELFAEVTILDRNRQVVCGDLVTAGLFVPDLTRIRSSATAMLSPSSSDTVLTLKALSIDSAYSINQRDAVRIEVLLADSAQHREVCQLRLKIHPTQASTSYQDQVIVRGLIVERGSDWPERSFVFVIDGEEFMPSHPDGLQVLSFTATIDLIDSRGLSKIRTKRSFVLADNFANECGAWLDSSYAGQGVEIIDAQTRCTPLRGGEVLIDLAINCEHSAAHQKPYPIYFEPVRRLNNSRGQVHEKIEGCVVEIALLPPSSLELVCAGERQQRQQVRLPRLFQSPEYDSLKMMLFSPEGQLLQVLYVPVTAHKIGSERAVSGIV
jgi:hypothetical protein